VQRLGAELLIDALGRIVEVARSGGGRLIVVDAIDEPAKAFYRRLDFIAVKGTTRLYLKIATARTSIRALSRGHAAADAAPYARASVRS
jgi:hypothetical protein